MDFKPRHPQPFTIQQAIGFDVSVIDQGVAQHLQYSHLLTSFRDRAPTKFNCSSGRDAKSVTRASVF